VRDSPRERVPENQRDEAVAVAEGSVVLCVLERLQDGGWCWVGREWERGNSSSQQEEECGEEQEQVSQCVVVTHNRDVSDPGIGASNGDCCAAEMSAADRGETCVSGLVGNWDWVEMEIGAAMVGADLKRARLVLWCQK
jgi:hypothetical protein